MNPQWWLEISTPLSVADWKKNAQKLSKAVEYLKSSIYQRALTGHFLEHSGQRYSETHTGHLLREHILRHKTKHNKIKRIKIVQTAFSNHNVVNQKSTTEQYFKSPQYVTIKQHVILKSKKKYEINKNNLN